MAELLSKDDINIGGSAFWIIIILSALMGLVYFLIWSFHNNSIKGTVISVIFISMILSGILLSKMKIFDWASWGDNALSFSLGFWIWILLGSVFGQQSILSIGQNHLFATISSELPQIVELVANTIIVPIAEEIFWMVGIPFALISIMNAFGKFYSFLKNPYFQMTVIILIGSVSFAFFHVGKLFIGFIIASMIFRTIMIVLIYGEQNFDILKGINLVVGFSIGSHIANNLVDYGVGKAWIVLQDNILIMLLIVSLFGVLFISGFNRLLGFILGNRIDLQDIKPKRGK